MIRNSAEQCVRNRRFGREGGRRMDDRPERHAHSPHCPACRRSGTALQAGEAEGGWWFVCVVCDHLWDQRSQVSERPHAMA
jgi:hypothetical protein